MYKKSLLLIVSFIFILNNCYSQSSIDNKIAEDLWNSMGKIFLEDTKGSKYIYEHFDYRYRIGDVRFSGVCLKETNYIKNANITGFGITQGQNYSLFMLEGRNVRFLIMIGNKSYKEQTKILSLNGLHEYKCTIECSSTGRYGNTIYGYYSGYFLTFDKIENLSRGEISKNSAIYYISNNKEVGITLLNITN